jgi:opacity protein-like surface antigen
MISFARIFTLGSLLGLSAYAHAQGEAAEDKWQFEFTPYLFGIGLNGSVGIDDVTADVDFTTDELLKHLTNAFMGTFEARKGWWLLDVDAIYTKLKDENTGAWQGPGGIGSATGTLEAKLSDQIYQLTLGYRAIDARTKLDVFGAARYTQLDTTLSLTVTTGGLLPGGSTSISEGVSWWDPVIGVRVIVPIAEHWSLLGYGDIGGSSSGSDRTYQLIAGVNWQLSETFAAKFGYRYLYQDYQQNNFVWDMTLQGYYLGLGIRF